MVFRQLIAILNFEMENADELDSVDFGAPHFQEFSGTSHPVLVLPISSLSGPGQITACLRSSLGQPRCGGKGHRLPHPKRWRPKEGAPMQPPASEKPWKRLAAERLLRRFEL